MDMDDRTLVMVIVNGIGARLTNDEKRVSHFVLSCTKHIRTGDVTAVQRVKLNPGGSKHSRRMLGTVRDAAVAFNPISDTKRLTIGGGVETTPAARLGDKTADQAAQLVPMRYPGMLKGLSAPLKPLINLAPRAPVRARLVTRPLPTGSPAAARYNPNDCARGISGATWYRPGSRGCPI